MLELTPLAPPGPTRSIITYSRSDLALVALTAATVATWLTIAGGAFSVRALVACQALFFAFYLAGSVVSGIPALAAAVSFELPLRLLVGYAVVNSALFVLSWVSPLGIVSNFASLLVLAFALFVRAGQRALVRREAASVWAVLLCLVATSLWCQDSIFPRAEQGDAVLFKPWVDGFYHAVHIRIFAAAHGAASIEDWRLAGIPARPYHYGMYMLPALIKQASGIHSYTAFAGALAPVGVFFTGLAAYSFIASLWGAWPGFAAAAALLLLPDGSQQGMHNPFMSYHWLTQISPSATYGLAVLALAWVFVIRGCTRGSRVQLFVGWSFAALALVYKLQYVVASSLLLLWVPALFFRAPVGRGRRALWVAASFAGYVLVLFLGQKMPAAPLIRFDGSSIGEILRLVETFARPGALRDYITRHMGREFSASSNLTFGIPYVLFATLGLFVPLLAVLIVGLRKRMASLHLLFPLMLVANFLVMFFGLALDMSSSTPDELSHRPLMIVYFFVVTWVGGALGSTLVGSRRLASVSRPALVGSAVLLLSIPALLGPGVQTNAAMPQLSPVRVPASVVEVAQYIHDHGGPQDVFQDSRFDRIYALAALSERRAFVSHTLVVMPFYADLVQSRSAIIDRFTSMRRPSAISAAARAFGFRWFVHERGDRLDWPGDVKRSAVLTTGPLTLYQF